MAISYSWRLLCWNGQCSGYAVDKIFYDEKEAIARGEAYKVVHPTWKELHYKIIPMCSMQRETYDTLLARVAEFERENTTLKSNLDYANATQNTYIKSAEQTISELRAENERLKDKIVQQCDSIDENLNTASRLIIERDQLRTKLQLAREALEKIALGESQFDNVDHMHTAREMLAKLEEM